MKNIINKFPFLKGVLKKTYYIIGSLLSDKKSSENFKIVSNGTYENLFGYYDKSPWSKDGKKMIYIRCLKTHKFSNGGNKAYIILLDLENHKEEIIGETMLWNTQQGSMLQWIGPDYNSKIIFNTLDLKGKHASCIYNTLNKESYYISSPVYAINSNGDTIYSLNFHQLGLLRPGYGYSIYPIDTYEKFTDKFISITDVHSNVTSYHVTKSELINIKPVDSMVGAKHYINHIQISQDQNHIVFLHRWIKRGVKFDRLMYITKDGSALKVLLDDGMISHYNWLNNHELIIYCHVKDSGTDYFKFNIENLDMERMNIGFPKSDGHPSLSPNGRYLMTDTYPNFNRKQLIYVHDLQKNLTKVVTELYLPIKYNNSCRVDLHPRWDWESSKICFDMVNRKTRQVAVLDLEDVK